MLSKIVSVMKQVTYNNGWPTRTWLWKSNEFESNIIFPQTTSRQASILIHNALRTSGTDTLEGVPQRVCHTGRWYLWLPLHLQGQSSYSASEVWESSYTWYQPCAPLQGLFQPVSRPLLARDVSMHLLHLGPVVPENRKKMSSLKNAQLWCSLLKWDKRHKHTHKHTQTRTHTHTHKKEGWGDWSYMIITFLCLESRLEWKWCKGHAQEIKFLPLLVTTRGWGKAFIID